MGPPNDVGTRPKAVGCDRETPGAAAPPGSTVGVVHAAHHLTDLPELTGVQKIMFSDWYDGPCTGLALYDGREYWFVMVTNDDSGRWAFKPRIYILHRPTAE